jgi:CRISPR-associated protein Cmr5
MNYQQTLGTRRQNSEQARGRHAWTSIQEIKGLKRKEVEKKYRALARGFNAMLQINGLGQTLAFLGAKSKPDPKKPSEKNEHYYLLKHITVWTKENFHAHNLSVINDQRIGFLIWVTDEATSSADYRRATTECLALGSWLRRFAEAELEGDES